MTGFVNLGQVRGEIAREISPAISSRLSHSSFWGEGPPRTRSVYYRGVGARALGSGLRALARRGDADGESGRTSRSESVYLAGAPPALRVARLPRGIGETLSSFGSVLAARRCRAPIVSLETRENLPAAALRYLSTCTAAAQSVLFSFFDARAQGAHRRGGSGR